MHVVFVDFAKEKVVAAHKESRFDGNLFNINLGLTLIWVESDVKKQKVMPRK